MVKFFLEIFVKILVTGLFNIIPCVFLMLIGEAIGLTPYLQDLTYKLWKRREETQLIYYSMTLPFIIYFLHGDWGIQWLDKIKRALFLLRN